MKNKYIDIAFFARKDSLSFCILPMLYYGVAKDSELALTLFIFNFKVGLSIIIP